MTHGAAIHSPAGTATRLDDSATAVVRRRDSGDVTSGAVPEAVRGTVGPGGAWSALSALRVTATATRTEATSRPSARRILDWFMGWSFIVVAP